MRKAFKISTFILLYFVSLNLSSQIRLGVLVHVSDSMITHMNFGFAQFSIERTDYELPFKIEPIIKSIADSLFINENIEVEVVEIDREQWELYESTKLKLSGGKLKKFKQKWYEGILVDYQLHAFVVFHSLDLNLLVGMTNIPVETLDLCFSNLGNKSRSTIYINLIGEAFWKPNSRKFNSSLIPDFYLNDDFKILTEGQKYSNEYLRKLEKPYTDLIKKQLGEMKRTKAFADMFTEFRRLIAIKNHKAQLESLKK
mgnify:CR=1 FL=1